MDCCQVSPSNRSSAAILWALVFMLAAFFFVGAKPAAAASISGTVTDELGAPLPNVRMSAMDLLGNWVSGAWVGGDGAYDLTGMTPGVYKVRTGNLAYYGGRYLDEWYSDVLVALDEVGIGATPVDVSASSATGIDFSLEMGKTVSGRVTGQSGLPLEGVFVCVADSFGHFVLSGSTAGDGTYEAVGLLPGSYLVYTSNTYGYSDEWYDDVLYQGNWSGAGATPLDLTSSDATGIDFQLAIVRSISGRVTDETTGDPVTSGEVGVRDEFGNWFTGFRLNADGTYIVMGLSPGTYLLRVYPFDNHIAEWYDNVVFLGNPAATGATPLDLSADDARGVDFQLATGRSISGIVTDETNGDPVANGYVVARDEVGEWVINAGLNADGTYTVNGLPLGTYKVSVHPADDYVAEWYDNLVYQGNYSGSGAAPLDLSAGDATGVDFQLVHGHTISGRVTDEVSGDPVTSAWMYAVDADGTEAKFVWINSDGTYALSGLLPGWYKVRMWNYQGYVNEWFDDDSMLADPTGARAFPIDLSSADATGIDFALAQGLTISGTVTDEVTGLGIGNVMLGAVSAVGAWVGYAYTDPSGAYSISDLVPGDYRVRTIWNDQGYVNEWYDNVTWQSDPDGAGATVLSLTTDATDIDFALAQGISISGRVTDEATGLGIENSEAAAIDAVGNYVNGAGTDSTGDYTISGLLPGDYRVRTWDHQGYVNEWYDDVIWQTDQSGAGATVLTLATDVTGVDLALAQGFSISGRVTDEATGLGIADVQVSARDAAGSRLAWDLTDSTGVYTVSGLLPGDCRVRTRNFQGYMNEWYDDVMWQSDQSGAGATVLTLTGDLTGIDFALGAHLRYQKTVTPGWNLLAGAPGSDILGQTAFGYTGSSYASTIGDALQAGKGYWVKFASAGTVDLAVVAAPVSVHLLTGWNLVGNPTSTTLPLPAGLTGFVYEGGSYASRAVLEPGQGAWVKSAIEQDVVLQ